MRALQRAVGGARTAAVLRPSRAAQRHGFRPAPVQAVLEQAVTTEDERLRSAEAAALADKRLLRTNGNGNGNGAAAAEAAQAVAPGDDDRQRFQLHWSVDMVGCCLVGRSDCLV